jgi:hypothetical protein
MDSNALIQKQLAHVSLQVEKVFEGIDESNADHRATPAMMSAREIAEHLGECYQAVITTAGGGKHEWGSFSIPDKSWTNVHSTMLSLREQAVAALPADERGAELATDFIILHDAYHVGQMCTNRLSLDPNWNAYSIYGM